MLGAWEEGAAAAVETAHVPGAVRPVPIRIPPFLLHPNLLKSQARQKWQIRVRVGALFSEVSRVWAPTTSCSKRRGFGPEGPS